jgi:hypothetical protein
VKGCFGFTQYPVTVFLIDWDLLFLYSTLCRPFPVLYALNIHLHPRFSYYFIVLNNYIHPLLAAQKQDTPEPEENMR